MPGIPGISHQNQSSISSVTGGNHNGSVSHSLMGSVHDPDSISIQQQSPSTPLTPPAAYNQDAIFANIMIGGGTTNGTTPHTSPTSPLQRNNASICFFPVSGSTGPPLTPTQTCTTSNINRNSSSPLSPPSSTELVQSTINSNFCAKPPPPLPPRGFRNAPPLPPKTYKGSGGNNTNSSTKPNLTPISISSNNNSNGTGKVSYRDKGPPPLPRMPIPSPNHYHQRVNSDIVLSSSSTSPNTNGGLSPCGMIMRRNSTMDNTLPPRRFSQGTSGQPPPLPPTPLSTTPNTPMLSQTLFNLLPGSQQPSSPSQLPPPLPPTISSSLMRPPPTPTSASPNSTTVPELPPKTYRLSNACR